jgi:hypothetical protein
MIDGCDSEFKVFQSFLKSDFNPNSISLKNSGSTIAAGDIMIG